MFPIDSAGQVLILANAIFLIPGVFLVALGVFALFRLIGEILSRPQA
jgi:hypothetical protein